MSSWNPTNDSCDYAIMLEDDIEVSPHFYFYAKSLINNKDYVQDPDMVGISLYTPSWNEIAYPNKIFDIPTRDPVFLMQLPCSWGAVYFPDKWRIFQQYFHDRMSGFDVPRIQNSNAENWQRSWKKYLIELMYIRGWMMMYPNFENLASLSTNHVEEGEHTGKNGSVSSKKTVSLSQVNKKAQERYGRTLVKDRSEMNGLFQQLSLPPIETLMVIDLHHEVSHRVLIKQRGLYHSLSEETDIGAISKLQGENFCSLDVIGNNSNQILHHASEERFFVYHPQYGLSNQIREIQLGLIMSKQLNRTLVVPPVIVSNGSFVDPEEIFDLESLPGRWIHYRHLRLVRNDTIRLVDMNVKHGKRFAPNYADKSFFTTYMQLPANFVSERIAFDFEHQEIPIATSGALFKGCKDQILVFNNIYFYSSVDWQSEIATLPDFSTQIWDEAKLRSRGMSPYNCLHLRRGDFEEFCRHVDSMRKSQESSPYKQSNFWESFTFEKCFIDPADAAHALMASSEEEVPLLVVTNENNMTLLNHSFVDFEWRVGNLISPEGKENMLHLQPAVDQAMCEMSEKFYGNYFSTFSRSIKARRSAHGKQTCLLGYDKDCLLPNKERRVSYVTSFWADSNNSTPHRHRNEIQAALLVNINNAAIDQVVVLLDGISERANCTHLFDEMNLLNSNLHRSVDTEQHNFNSIQKLSCINVEGGQPTYFEIFKHALSEKVIGDIVIVANADQAFDDTISTARYLNPSVLAVLGTRGFSSTTVPLRLLQYYDSLMNETGNDARHESEEEVDRCGTTPNSWDTFIFHQDMIRDKLEEEDFLRMNKANDSVPFHANEYGAENAALWALQHHSNFTSIFNACEEINAWSFHLANKMHKTRTEEWNSKEMYQGIILVPEPYTFASKHPTCLVSGNCFAMAGRRKNDLKTKLSVLVSGAGSSEVNGCYLLKGRNGNAWEFELDNSITGRTFEMFKVGESGWWNIMERVTNDSGPNPPHYGVEGDTDAVLPPVDDWGSVEYSGSWLGMDPMPIIEVINEKTCVSRAESERECLSKCNGLLLTSGRSNHTHFEEVWSACKCAQCQWSYAAIDTLLDQGNLCANDSSHLKDFQVEDGWANYRLSDAFSNELHNTLQEWKSYYMDEAPIGSLIRQYYQASQEGQEIRFKNYDVLFDVVSKRASTMSSDDFSPTNSVVIHVRLGDVIDWAVDSVRDMFFSQRYYYQPFGEEDGHCGRPRDKENSTPLVQDWNAYVKPLSYYSEMLDIVSKYSSVILMGSAHGLDPNHRCWNNTTLTASKSCQYMHGLKSFFERLLPRNISVSLRLGNPPDDDVVFASHAACFIPSGGGYSRIIGNLHSMRGGCSHRYL